jgi:glutamate carboxypeptidase
MELAPMTGALAPLLEAAERRAPEALGLLRRWVETNSYTSAIANVNAMGRLLREAFLLPGLELQVRAGNGYGDHLLWTTPAWAARPDERILLLGHHDTVFPPGSFEGWLEQGDIIRGPGVLDMKGGIMTVRTALAVFAEAGRLAELPLAFLCVADEEAGSPDSRPFTLTVARGARAALVFEAGRVNDDVITARKGTGSAIVSVRGKAAHAGNAHREGVNAIWALSRFVDAAQRLTDYERGVTVNVGTISGGTSKNTVPEHCECSLDFRIVHRSDGPSVMEALESAARSLESETGARFTLLGGVRRPPLEPTEGSRALLARYAEHAAAEGLGVGESPLIGGGSDANDVGSLGVPVIDGLGPRGRGFHTHDEHIEAATLARKTAALVRFLAAWP